MVYNPADITVIGIVRLPKSVTLQEARRAQAAMPRARGRGWDQWFLRPAPRAPRAPATSKYDSSSSQFIFKKE